MTLITSLEDGRMTMFRGYVASGGVGFMGHEFLLFLSLQAALEQIKELRGVPTLPPIVEEETSEGDEDPDPDAGDR